MAEREKVGIELDAELQAWRRAHPHATFAEMEAGVRELLNRIRPQLIAELTGGLPEPVRRCPECGESMQSRGRHRRLLLCEDGEAIQLDRPYFVCPACTTGLFPPG
jgi:hypothetical protein